MTDFKVMLVDDEHQFLETLCKRLRKRKLDVTTASSGREALDVLRTTAIDVVVLDVKMPDMDGITTLKEMRKVNPSVQVIMLTGHAELEVAMQGMESGAFDYLIKPADIDELLYRLQDAYTKKSCEQEHAECVAVGVGEET